MGTIIHDELEIGVIDNALLKKVFDDLAPRGEAGRIARREGIPLDEVDTLRLEFLNILQIDHIWMLKGLTKLSISNNIIEKIENLSTLVNLKELDLSFNKITVIENLEALVNLEILTLYANNISTIDNIHFLSKLIIFSIGKNQIEDRTNIYYLRQFDALKSFNIEGNPCCDTPHFRAFIAAFLPDLTYYEYVMITAEERTAAQDLYRTELSRVIESESEIKAIKAKLAADAAEEALYADSFVEYLGGTALFDNMFKNDPDGNTLLKIGSTAEDVYYNYKKKFVAVTRKLFEVGQTKYLIRKEEVAQFFKCVDGAKIESQRKSQKIMEDFMHKKFLMTSEIRQMQIAIEEDLSEPGSPEYEQMMLDYQKTCQRLADLFEDDVHQTWKQLMCFELRLFEQLEELNAAFGLALTDMVNSFLEVAAAQFTECRGLEVQYMDKIGELAQLCLQDHANAPDGTHILPKDLEKIVSDKDSVLNAVAASHDVHMLTIDERDDRLTSRANTWLKNLVDNLQKDEVNRDRTQVFEIIHFLEIQKEEFNEMNVGINQEPELDPDVIDALAE